MPGFKGPPFRLKLIINRISLEKEKWIEDYDLIFSRSPIYSLKEQFELPLLIPKCDLFWSPHYNIPLSPLRARKRVVTIHDACHLTLPNLLSIVERSYAKLMFRQAAARSDHVITDSHFSSAELMKFLRLSEGTLSVIYPGVDVKRFTSKSKQEEALTLFKKYSLPDTFFLFVSNLKSHKNIKLILNAYEKFDIELPLVVVGKKSHLLNLDPSVCRIETSPRLQKKVVFTGEVLDEELPLLYSHAAALVFPSYYEGFGLPPLESMAAGCPVISSNRASLPEVCGDAALYIDPDSPEQLYDAMQTVMNQKFLRAEKIRKGKDRVSLFSWDSTIASYRKLFEKVVYAHCHRP